MAKFPRQVETGELRAAHKVESGEVDAAFGDDGVFESVQGRRRPLYPRSASSPVRRANVELLSSLLRARIKASVRFERL